MKKYTNKILKNIAYLIVAVLVGVTAVYAGDLIPQGDQTGTNTMHNLQDIYKLATGGGESEINSTLTTSPELVGSGHTLNEVYDAVLALTEAPSGGADLSNMYNGSSDSIDGGSQANGGVDDANYDSNGVPQTPPSDRYQTDWTTCNVGNNYCGTGEVGANAKDEATGIVWSYPLKNTNCVDGVCESYGDFDTAPADLTGCDTGNCAYWDTDTYYSWDNSRADNDGQTAQQLCQSKGEGWNLPHQKQLMQAYIDGSYGNLDPDGVDRLYWSATTDSGSAGNAWGVNVSSGSTSSNNKGNNSLVRCVRE